MSKYSGTKINIIKGIENVIKKETESFDSKNINLFLSLVHPDMVWVWPSDTTSFDPIDWVSPWGRFEDNRWRGYLENFFKKYALIHNIRKIQRIEVTAQYDGAFAIIDVDTRWRSNYGEDLHWYGRVCKTYTLKDSHWKMISQVGPIQY